MESRVNYAIVGLFVIALGFGLVFAGFWLSRDTEKKQYDFYLAYMSESVSGLSVHSPVKFNGVEVGFVDSISLNKKNPQEVKVLMKLEHGTPVTTSTTATVMSQGFTGIDYIGLQARHADAPRLKKAKGQPYPIIKSVPSLLMRLDNAVRDLTNNFDVISARLKVLLEKKNIDAFSDSLQSAKVALANTATASKNFPQAVEKFNKLTGTLQDASQEVKQTAIDSQVAISNFSTQVLPSTVQLLQRLNNVATNLQSLSQELKQQPSLVLRGKTPPPLGPGE